MKRFRFIALFVLLGWFFPSLVPASGKHKGGGSMALSGPVDAIGSNKIKAYGENLAEYFPDKSPDIKHIPGYAAARVFAEIFGRVGSFTSRGIAKAAESVRGPDMGLPEKIFYTPGDHVAFPESISIPLT